MLEQDVRTELNLVTGHHRAGSIGVVVQDGVVSLTGVATSYSEKWTCQQAAMRVAGVTAVRDHLQVHPAEGRHPDDRRVEEAARAAHAWDARVPDGVTARVTDGVLRLEGTVSCFAEREAAEEAIRHLIGVRRIVNEIRLARTPVPADLPHQVETALRRRFGAGAGGISIATAGGVVTLWGAVSSLAVVDDLERVVHAVPGVTAVVANLQVRPRAAPVADHRAPADPEPKAAVLFHDDIHDGLLPAP